MFPLTYRRGKDSEKERGTKKERGEGVLPVECGGKDEWEGGREWEDVRVNIYHHFL